MKLRLKLLMFLAAMAAAMGLAMGGLVYWGVSNALVQEVAKRGIALVTEATYQPEVKAAFISRSEKILLTHLNSSLKSIAAIYMEAISLDGTVIAHTNVTEKGKVLGGPELSRILAEDSMFHERALVDGKPALVVTCPVWAAQEMSEGEAFLLTGGQGAPSKSKAGILRVGISLTETLATTRRVLTWVFSAIGGVCLAGIGFILFFTGKITRQLELLVKATTQLGRGDICTNVPVLLSDEIGDLARGFNSMAKNLEETTVSRDKLSAEVAERIRTEEALLYSDERFQQVSMQSGDWIWETDAEGRYTYSSPMVEGILGYKPEEIIGKHFYDMFAPDEKERLAEPCKAAMARKETFTRLPNRNLHKNGQEVILETTAGPVLDDAGALMGYRGIDRDITERKKLEAAMLQSEKLSAIGQLAAGVAHEINNPLGIILGFAQSVAKRIKTQDDPLTLPLKTIEREAVRCRDLVQNLLVFSRTSKGSRLENLDINAAAENSLSLISAQTKTRSVELVRELGAGLPPIHANKTQIQQIIINLANNAIDAMPDGGTLTVSTALSGRRPGHVEIRVRDTGTGIPKELHKKIFDPFFTTKEVGKGTGLGLSLVYEIAHKHGGAVELESEEGKGTEFTVFLPVHAPAPEASV